MTSQDSPAPLLSWTALWQLIKQRKRTLIGANVLAILATLANVPIPLLLPFLVDEVLLEKSGPVVPFINQFFTVQWHQPWLYIVVVTVAIFILRGLYLGLYVAHVKRFVLVTKGIICHVRTQLLQRLKRVSIKEYETLGSGTVSSLLITDLDTIDTFLSALLSKSVIAVASILGTATILLWIHWPLALFILCLNPVVIYFTMILGRKVKALKQKENQSVSVFQQALSETLQAMQQVRAAQRDQFFFQRLVDLAGTLRHNATAFSWQNDSLSRVSFIVLLFGFDVFRATCMLLVLFSDLSVGQMFAIFGYLWFMMGPCQELLNLQYSYNSASAALKRLNQLIGLKLEPDETGVKPVTFDSPLSVDIRKLSFHYHANRPVLKDISLKIDSGQKVAFVGPSGSGKTTLIHVILGLYQPSCGELLINQKPVSEIGLSTVRKHTGTVLQHPVLFDGSVRINLTLGEEYSDEVLWHVLEVAQLKDFIEDLADKLDTQIGLQGIRLSGGQRQRLAIARMLLTKPQMVILDEATSALDADTEAKLFAALSDELKNQTLIVIAHRLSAIQYVDHIYVFDEGRIFEQGAHHDLLANEQIYARLYGAVQGVKN